MLFRVVHRISKLNQYQLKYLFSQKKDVKQNISITSSNMSLNKDEITKLVSQYKALLDKGLSTSKEQHKSALAMIKQLANTNGINDKPIEKDQFQNHDLLSQKMLSKLSPLMRQVIFNGKDQKLIKTTTKLVEQIDKNTTQDMPSLEDDFIQPEMTPRTTNHNLKQFRHMLAGPISNQIMLDKFCLKKECPLLLDIKYDGQRTMICFERGKQLDMTSRNGKSQDRYYRMIHTSITNQLMNTDIESIMIDGEIVALDRATLSPLSFGQLLKYKKIREFDLMEMEEEDTDKVFLVYVFDVLEKNGQNLLEKQLVERRKFIPDIPIFKPSECRIVHFPQERAKIFDFFKEALERKYEGLIIKGTKDKYYTNDSRTHWKKLKRGFTNNRDTRISKIQLDLIVMGANKGKGSNNTKLFTSFLLGAKYQNKIIPISAVGTGFTQQMLVIINNYIIQNQLIVNTIPEEYDLQKIRYDAYFKPSWVFEVHAQQLTISPLYKLGKGQFGGYSLRFPVFRGIRRDKGVNEATTGEQILQLSKLYNFNLPS